MKCMCKIYETLDKKSRESSKLYEQPKLVYSEKKKLAVKHMGCKRCEMNDWRFV